MELLLTDKLIITSLTDNYYDALRKDEKVAYRFGIWNQNQFPPIICEMGLSYHIEAISGSEHRYLMCDFSYTSNALLHNIDLLGIDTSKVEALILSHGHKDHSFIKIKTIQKTI
jgi:7,8-dihydropterin-6-yl-methyl-4-(beta-D-ribofuranosyl)aminobenzene 5'-phosphate synthase